MSNVIKIIVLVGKVVDTVIPIVSNVVNAVKLWRSERKKEKEKEV
jgi:hypothetical protein